MSRALLPILLLVISNVFMTVAWYGHLKHRERPLLPMIFASWSVAFFEYIFQVPANRLGAHYFTLTQLKIMQEAITLCVFTLFVWFAFKERPTRRTLMSYALLVGAVYFAFRR